MKSLVLVLLFFYLSDATAVRLERSVANANEFVDELFTLCRDWMPQHHLDPFYMAGLDEYFWFEWLWMNHTGEIYLRDIYTERLSTLNREGDSIITYENKNLTIHIGATVDKLTVASKFSAVMLGLKPEGYMTASITNQQVFMKFGLDLCNFTITVDEFKLRNTGKINIDIDDSGILTGIYNLFVDIVASLFRDNILDALSLQVQTLVQQKLDGMKPILPPAQDCNRI